MTSETLNRNETGSLISSNKVEGTAVYNRGGDKLGSIEQLMLDKHSGKVDCAVMSFGGFLGMGNDHYPLPWNALTYDTDRGGYVVDIDKSKLENAPRYDRENEPAYDETYRRNVYGHYGITY